MTLFKTLGVLFSKDSKKQLVFLRVLFLSFDSEIFYHNLFFRKSFIKKLHATSSIPQFLWKHLKSVEAVNHSLLLQRFTFIFDTLVSNTLVLH